MKNPNGSEAFNTAVIKTDEYILMAKAMQAEGATDPVEIALDIEMIDDMLAMKRLESLTRVLRYTKSGRLRRNNTYQDFLERRLEVRAEIK